MRRERVLIVEDDLEILKLVDYNLTRKGYTTSGAVNGNLAIAALDEFKPDSEAGRGSEFNLTIRDAI